MELNQQIAAKFTAARATRIVSEDGSSCANFEEGQTRSIPRKLFTAALQAGLIPEESLEAEEPKQDFGGKSQEEIVAEGLLEACKTLIIRGNPKDFTVVGQPRSASVKKLVDFDFNAQQVKRAFEEAMHEVEQDGNESTEHSEPSSSATG